MPRQGNWKSRRSDNKKFLTDKPITSKYDGYSPIPPPTERAKLELRTYKDGGSWYAYFVDPGGNQVAPAGFGHKKTQAISMAKSNITNTKKDNHGKIDWDSLHVKLDMMVKRRGRHKVGKIVEMFGKEGVPHATVQWGDPMGWEFKGKTDIIPVSELGEVTYIEQGLSKGDRVRMEVKYPDGTVFEEGAIRSKSRSARVEKMFRDRWREKEE